ncbi:MAG: alpha/beta fold hydrolase [Fimbriimonadaceae bacterium]|nr:alpha/beta fold hydrolase [Fimbriimonadaceae bacterium]
MQAMAWLALVWTATAAVAAGELAGFWEGDLPVGGQTLKIQANLTWDGTLYRGWVKSPQQAPTAFAVDPVAPDAAGGVRLTVPAVKATVALQAPQNGRVAAVWRQGTAELPFTLAPATPPGPRPQDPRPPFPYRAEEVSYRNEPAGVTLAGTLTLPPGAGPHPAVILVTGSGSQNRDEEILDHRPFAVWADTLTRRGIAVLRVDDRGVGGSSRSAQPADDTTADYATDVLAGLAYLRGRPELDSRRLAVMGHSEGGLIAPAVAAWCPDLAAIVLLAGPGVSGERILLAQSALIAKAEGASDEDLAKAAAANREAYAVLRSKAPSEAEPLLRELLTGPGRPLEKVPAEQVDQQLRMLNSAWFRRFLDWDPAPVLRQVRCPVLAINGSLDLQVPAAENLAAIATALQAAGNRDATTRELAGLNHLLQACQTGRLAEYGTISETINPAALAVVADWLTERLRPPPKIVTNP